MKRFLVLLIAITSIALVGPGLSQTGPGDSGVKEPRSVTRPSMGRRGTRSAAQGLVMLIRAYNPQTVTTLKGTVESLGTFPPKSQVPGVSRSVVLKTEEGKMRVYLAPDWFLDQQKIALKAGETLEVTGSKVTILKEPAVIGKDLTVGGKSVKLRNDRGYPIWMEKPPAAGSPAK